MALGWPVSENGPAPGWPMRPVARWQLMMALPLSVPCADWFTPWENAVTTRFVPAKSAKKRATSASERPVAAAVAAMLGAMAAARSRAPSKPLVWSPTKRSSRAPVPARCTSRPENRAVSVPGSRPRKRSASSPVWVRRGSITTSLVPRLARASTMRRNRIGWHQAVFEPTSTMRSASSRSS